MLDNFFRINMPYGLKKNSDNTWLVFNREYMPLGWNAISHKKSIHQDMPYSDLPIYTMYESLDEYKLKLISHDEGSIVVGDDGKINLVFLYNDRTNPTNNSKYWETYFEKIKLLGDIKANGKSS